MKKIIYKIGLMACAGLMFNACDLDEENPSAGDATLTVFETWSGLENRCYSSLNDELYTSCDWLFLSECGTDLWLPKSNGTGYKQVLCYEDLVSSYNTVQKVFQQCYAMISNCNTVINEAVYLRDGNADDIKVLVAETKTLRALYYSILVAHYGPVTLNLESSSSITSNLDLYPKRNSEKEIYDQIIKDLKEAIEDLGITPYAGNTARVTKKSAKGLLARVYAQRAGLGTSKYGDAAEYWKLAAETAEDLITNKEAYGAFFYEDIADMWADANNRENKEALMIAAGCDGSSSDAWAYSSKNNKLAAYSTGGFFSEFYPTTNYRPDKNQSYFYGRINSQTWMPSKYLMYCFNPKWDRRWEYSFTYAWASFSMVSAGWIPYDKGQVKIDTNLCKKYDIDSTLHKGQIIYPYADCHANQYESITTNQYQASIWPKGDHSGNTANLLSIAPSSELIGTGNYAGSTKAYAVPYPIDLNDDRFNCVFTHTPYTEDEKKQCTYAVVCLNDLYDSHDYPYGGIAQGSDAANPPAIGDGLCSSSACPGLIKFNWSYDGVFTSNLQVKTGNMFIMRMAEVYLIAAEAEQQLGNGGKAADYLNVLRKRAARSGATEATWKIGTATEDDIFDEYARELCGEFSRWALLKRHNAFETRLQKYNDRAYKSFKPYHYNRPIAYNFLSTILNSEEYGDNGYGSTASSGLKGFE